MTKDLDDALKILGQITRDPKLNSNDIQGELVLTITEYHDAIEAAKLACRKLLREMQTE